MGEAVVGDAVVGLVVGLPVVGGGVGSLVGGAVLLLRQNG